MTCGAGLAVVCGIRPQGCCHWVGTVMAKTPATVRSVALKCTMASAPGPSQNDFAQPFFAAGPGLAPAAALAESRL